MGAGAPPALEIRQSVRMARPTLKQFSNLREADFSRHGVWVSCHHEDYDEPWYDDTDEETFRPSDAPLPVPPGQGEFLVRATATLGDGTEMSGFVTPSPTPDVSFMQPHLFAGGQAHGFWGGMIGIPESGRARLLQALGKGAGDVFPIMFKADDAACAGSAPIAVPGWLDSCSDAIPGVPDANAGHQLPRRGIASVVRRLLGQP